MPVLPPRAVSAARARGGREGDWPRDAGASALFFGMVRSPNFPRVSIFGERACRRSGSAHGCKTRAQVLVATTALKRRVSRGKRSSQSERCSRAQQARQRNMHPIWPIVQLVPELVQRLVEYEGGKHLL